MSTDPRNSSGAPYWAALDGLRAIAILAVVGFHTDLGAKRALVGGFVGVDLFFVLSGALITTLLVREYEASGTIDLRQFYLRRLTRLYPALLFMLAFCVAYTALCWPAPMAADVRRDSLYTLLYVSNWVNVSRPKRLLSTTWSLSIEEWFYLVWPIVLRRLLQLKERAGSRPIVLLLVFVIVACFARRFQLTEVEFHSWRRVYFGLDTRIDSLALGCLVAIVLHTAPPRTVIVTWGASISLVLFGVACLVSDSTTRWFTLFGYTCMGLLCAFLVGHAMVAPRPWRWLVSKPLVMVGKLSYSIYLWLLIVPTILYGQPIVVQLLALAFVSAASYVFIEQPGLRLRRLFRRSSAPR